MIRTFRARENPFATWRLHAIPFRLPGFSWDECEARWRAANCRGAIVGPHGSGKTQLLEEFAARLAEQGISVKRLRLNAGQARTQRAAYQSFVEDLNPADVVLLDGAEQLGLFAWRRFLKQTQCCRGVLVTTHRPGRLPTLFESHVSLALLDELLREIVPGEWAEWRETAHFFFRKCHGNLRDVLRSLYDQYAAGPAITGDAISTGRVIGTPPKSAIT